MDQPLKPGLRVTLRMGCSPANVEVGAEGGKTSVFSASLATPMEAMQSGLYWGYFVRIATDLNDMTTNCPFTVSPALEARWTETEARSFTWL